MILVLGGNLENKPTSGTTTQLLRLCYGYFISYVLTGVLVKYFTALREPRMGEFTYLFNNTLSSALLCVAVVLALGWVGRLARTSNRLAAWGPFKVPVEAAYVVPSGLCTAVVIPATTLMYSLPISVLVAMVIMRGSVIAISRAVDEIQIRQGILRRRVYHEENVALVFALLAVATSVLLLPIEDALHGNGITLPAWIGYQPGAGTGSFDFVHNRAAMTIFTCYVVAYAARIYIMNYYKNTRGHGVRLDNRGFFAVEQLSATVTMALVAVLVIAGPALFGWRDPRILEFSQAARNPDLAALVAGIPFALVAFTSVFIFMFEGRTATFATLVNRLTSLLAGTTATLVLWVAFGQKFPSVQDWVAATFILVAVYFLTRAERRRSADL